MNNQFCFLDFSWVPLIKKKTKKIKNGKENSIRHHFGCKLSFVNHMILGHLGQLTLCKYTSFLCDKL